jgi:hypothetical protein
LKKIEKFTFLALCLIGFLMVAHAQNSPLESASAKSFKKLLAHINAGFIMPEGFVETAPQNNDKTNYQYALQVPNEDFEVRIQVNDNRKESRKWARGSAADNVNPDSLYSKVALAQINSMAGDGEHFSRPIPQRILQDYNADIGRSCFFSLADSPVTKHYQYALLIIIQKNHYGSITVLCLGNDRGPEFFGKINKLRNCLKFKS